MAADQYLGEEMGAGFPHRSRRLHAGDLWYAVNHRALGSPIQRSPPRRERHRHRRQSVTRADIDGGIPNIYTKGDKKIVVLADEADRR